MPYKDPQKQKEWKKEWREKNHEKEFKRYSRRLKNKSLAKSIKNWREKNPEKNVAHRKVFVELRAGRIQKGVCFCGEKRVEAHHENYLKPLEIIWLCKMHHREFDLKKKQRERIATLPPVDR